MPGILDGNAGDFAKTSLYTNVSYFDSTRHNDDKADEGKSADANKCTNCNSEAASSEERLEFILLGFPRLKAKICINVLNIGPRASGKWYIKTVEQGWSKEHGYITKAVCSRGIGGGSQGNTGNLSTGGGGTQVPTQ